MIEAATNWPEARTYYRSLVDRYQIATNKGG